MLAGIAVGIWHAVEKLANTLGMSDGAIFVTHEKRAQIPNLIVKLSNLSVEVVVLG